MKKWGVTRNGLLTLLGDIAIIVASLYLSYLLRFDFNIPDNHIKAFTRVIVFVVLVKLAVFYLFSLYRGMWRYTSITDLLNISKATFVSSLVIVGTLSIINRMHGYSRSVFLMDMLFTLLFVSGFRIAIRVYFEYAAGETTLRAISKGFAALIGQKRKNGKRVLILGAGDCGEKIYREIVNNSSLGLSVVGFLDDNPVKIGRKIHGVPVLGSIATVERIVPRMAVDELIIAIPTATGEQMRRIVYHCKKGGVPFKTVPGFPELINGVPSVTSLRKVAYRDLLCREPVCLDSGAIGAYIRGKTVLVTGAGGSIGSELCRQICNFSPKRLVLLERAESALYEIGLELGDRCRGMGVSLVPVLGDILDISRLDNLFGETAPHIVFHAAAYKHVPMLEEQPWEAVKNNIIGTRNVVEAAKRFSAERFVLVSTDKAVRPTNVMGATKRVAEMLVQCLGGKDRHATQFVAVRFGNVLGSAGSVVPLFQKQIERGGPVTVTHPDVTRFFMTISEACQLILQAAALGNTNGGNATVFVLKMGSPVRIVDMAKDLIRLSGFEPGRDIQIEFIGLRPGEKLYEELVAQDEEVVSTGHEKIMVIHGKGGVDDAVLLDLIGELESLAEKRDGDGIKECLKKIVPEYTPFLRN